MAYRFDHPRLFDAKHGKVDMHGSYRRGRCNYREVDLFAGEAVEVVNEVVAIDHLHPAAIGPAG